MIKINLLPREKRPKRGEIKAPRTVSVVMALLAVAGMAGYWLFVKWDIQRLRTSIAVTQSEVAVNRQSAQVVEQYARKKQQLGERLALVQRLATHQDRPVRLLNGLSEALPDGGWLTSISKSSGTLTIQGYASSHFVVAELMLALQRMTRLVTNVELSFSELELYEGRPVERFEILATLSG